MLRVQHTTQKLDWVSQLVQITYMSCLTRVPMVGNVWFDRRIHTIFENRHEFRATHLPLVSAAPLDIDLLPCIVNGLPSLTKQLAPTVIPIVEDLTTIVTIEPLLLINIPISITPPSHP